MSVSCKFRLIRSSNIYYCGERIEGSVTICPLKLRQVEAICLQFNGQTQVAWWDLDKTAMTANKIEHNDFSTQEIREKTLLSNRQKHVCDQLKLANSQWLQPHVEYVYQFSFLIPQQVAATSRCPLGECEYVLQLVLQHTKKANKEFHQRIIVKRKLDLSQNLKYIQPCTVTQENQFGRLSLSTPCSGFTPGQQIPYLLNFQAAQLNCRVLVQLYCFIRCRSATPCDSEKLIKQIINTTKHIKPGETFAHCTLPLNSYISMPLESVEDESIISYQYLLEAKAINTAKKILLSVDIPLTIGTTPCFKSHHDSSESDSNLMCYDNYGSSYGAAVVNSFDSDSNLTCYDNYGSSYGAAVVNSFDVTAALSSSNQAQQIYESLGLLPINSRTTHLRRSLRYCCKKISKFI